MSYSPPPPPPPPPPPGGGFGAPPPGYGPPGGGFGGGSPGQWQFADLGPRIVAGLIDYVAPSFVVYLVIFVLSMISESLSLLGLLLYPALFAFQVWNSYTQGQTGQSIGKKQQGIKVVSTETSQPIGGGMGIVRWLAHIVDALPCCVPGGYIYGLFIDKDKQTFADKIMKTVVVKA